MEFYIYVRRDKTDHYFLDNKVNHFKIRLNAPINLEGLWKVGLTEFYATYDSRIRKKTYHLLYIFSDLCKESIIHGSKISLLRRVYKNETNAWKSLFNLPFYLPLNKGYFQEFEIQIKTDDSLDADFLTSPIHLTLHFKQYPFYADYGTL